MWRSLIVGKYNALNASQRDISLRTVPTSMTRAMSKRKIISSRKSTHLHSLDQNLITPNSKTTSQLMGCQPCFRTRSTHSNRTNPVQMNTSLLRPLKLAKREAFPTTKPILSEMINCRTIK